MRHLFLPFAALLMTGCVTAELQGTDATDYRMLESGQAKTLHVVNVSSHSQVVVGAGRTDLVLADVVPKADDRAALLRLRNDARPWRRLDQLGFAMEELGKSLPSDRPRWVLSDNPLVVAIGARETAAREGSPALRGGLRLVAAGDLSEPASRLFVITKWQTKSSADSAKAAYTPTPGEPTDALPAEIVLAGPKTLGELLAEHPWDTRHAHPATKPTTGATTKPK